METVQSKILVAEDSRVNQMILVRILRQLGLNPDVVSNGSEAVEAATENKYDVVLMDVNMPVMDGIEATWLIVHSQHANDRPIIIALTADSTLEEKENCLAAGMDDFIVKPFPLAELLSTLRKWIPLPLNPAMEGYRCRPRISQEIPAYPLTQVA
jgi:two-component system, sensor histidine kinase and response regulator